MAAMTNAQYDAFIVEFETCIATLGNKVADSLKYGYNDQELIATFNYAVFHYNIFADYDPTPTQCFHCDEDLDECDDEQAIADADDGNCLTTEEIKVIINHLSSVCYACI